MKKIFFIAALFLSGLGFKADAQLRVNINIGRQPTWGPTGYDYVNYYYLPDMDVYYDVPRGLFVYYNLGRWRYASSLPARYGRYDLYHSYKVVVNDRDPWLRNSYYRSHYAGYRGRSQQVIRDSRDNRYSEERNRYNRGDERHARDYGRDNGRGNGGRNNGHGNEGSHGKGNEEHGHDHEDHHH